MFKLFKYMKKSAGWIGLILIMLLLQVYCDLALPAYTADIVDVGINNADIHSILSCGIKMLLMAALSVGCTLVVSFLSSRVAAAFSRDVREAIYWKVLNFSNKEINQFSISSLITRSTNDVSQVQNILGICFRTVLYAPILGIGGIIMAVRISSSLWWTIALAVILTMLSMGIIFMKIIPAYENLQKLLDHVNMVAREILTGVPVIRAFTRQKEEQKRFGEASCELAGVNLFVNRIMLILTPLLSLITNGLVAVILYAGAKKAVNGMILTGNIMAFIQYAVQIVNAFVMISSLAMALPRAIVSGNRISEVLDTKQSIQQEINNHLIPMKGMRENKSKIEFENVSFRYPGAEEDTLKNISFQVEAGKTLALVGSTGSGKSTLVQLILRLQDATEGNITVDGQDIRTMDLEQLRNKIGYVSQSAKLFSGTISSNLKKGKKDAAEEEMIEALTKAQAMEFISEKDGGLETTVAQNGTNFSGGQKQRLSIARAMIRKPEIYLFDDCFSALDVITDAKLRQSLSMEESDAVKLIVSQRISTIIHADQIIVLDGGEIVGKGTHEELVESCDVYKEIAKSQIKEEGKLL